MENQLKNNMDQVVFFDLIKKSIPTNQSLVNEISDILNIGTDAAYRRIRGVKMLDFEETMKLSRHFRISLDAVSSVTQDNLIICRYIPLNLKNTRNYMTYLNAILRISDNTKVVPEGEMITFAVDIPFVNLLHYKELTFFKVYSWSKSVYGYEGTFEQFISTIDIPEINEIHKRIATNYLQIPSSEIWTSGTLDTMIRLISYRYEMKHFGDANNALLLCEQLLDMINTLQHWTEKGTKGREDIPYKFYVSEIDSGNTFVLFKMKGELRCLIRLFTFNGLNISNELFCEEAEQWLYNLSQRAILISGASEKERFKFFNSQRNKIELLIEKIKLDMD